MQHKQRHADGPRGTLMRHLVTAPLRASRHLAIWIVWQSTGVTLLAPQKRP